MTRRTSTGGPRPRLATPWLAAVCLASCLSYSPHEVPSGPNRRSENLARLESRPLPEVLRFAVVGDVQRAFDDAADAVRRLNRIEDLAFVVQVGDFTELGREDEFVLMADVFDRLAVPWFVVVGNHDLLGNGPAIFDALLGPRNHDFTWRGTRFVFLDSNSREYAFEGVPDLAWLEERLGAGGDPVRTVLFAHVPPESGDFDGRLREPFYALLQGAGVALALYGHEHHYRTAEHGGAAAFVADFVKHRTFLLVEELPSGELEVQRVPF